MISGEAFKAELKARLVERNGQAERIKLLGGGRRTIDRTDQARR
jgi:hypothetical protein